ncbi:MAG: hypothetical protein RL117_805 [Verrucomicrobiota bacterium]|jgi:hypothetical protein
MPTDAEDAGPNVLNKSARDERAEGAKPVGCPN